MIDPEGFVLIGGASSRMGRDKAQLTIAGQKLFEHAADALREVCANRITLVGKVGCDFVNDLPMIDDVVFDTHENMRAPLIGVCSALIYAKTPWIAILACDLPFVTTDLMIRLWSFCSDNTDAVVPVQPDGRPQPLCAFYQREKCLPTAREMLGRGDLKLQRFLKSLATRCINFDDIADLESSADFFLNINKPEDHKVACEISRARAPI
ncbi:MAG: molybdenum cofactor guanylyltransferase [Acidobacteriota bacterium]